MNARADALRDSLMHLEDAGQQMAVMLRRRRWGVVLHQIMPAENIEAGTRAGTSVVVTVLVVLAAFSAYVWWIAAIVAGVAASALLDLPLEAAVIGCFLAAIVARAAITVAYVDDVLGPPDGTTDLYRTVGDASRSLHEAQQAGCDIAWAGGDPSVADRPWRMLPAIHATVAMVRRAQALAAAPAQRRVGASGS